MMRSLVFKLTLGFLLVGITGAGLVAIITSQRTELAFDRFVNSRNHQEVAEILGSYYVQEGSWAGVDAFIAANPYLDQHSPQMVLLDNSQQLVFGRQADYEAWLAEHDSLDERWVLEVDGRSIGTVVVVPTEGGQFGHFDLENEFLRNVASSSLLSALIAGFIALVMGVVLARSLTQPIQALTAVTKTMAAGQLGQKVDVRSRDEVGQLAASFNQMSAELAHASQLRRQMTADIAHDLRTPLSVLGGYMEGLKEGTLTGSKTLYTIMYEEVAHLQHLVDDLRTLSLADAGELPLNKRAIDPKALLERAGLAYVMKAQEKGVGLRVAAPDELPSVIIDVERMTQVFNNLVSNALRHTSAGEIVLAAAAQNGQVQLEVRDSGVGIAPAALPHIFDRFYRLDPARQRSTDGSSGLGLAIAKAIVEAHEGRITAVSALGEGTTFVVSLPVLPSAF